MGGRGGSSGSVLGAIRSKLEKEDWWKDTEKYERNPLKLLNSPTFMFGIEDKIGREAFNRGYEITSSQVKSLSKKMIIDLDKKSKANKSSAKVESQDEYAKRYFKEHYNKNKESQKTFVNSFGEATKREITSQTYKRQQNRQFKEIISFIGGKNRK